MNWHELFSYSADVGHLVWKARPLHHFANKNAWAVWNSKHSERRACAKHGRGYCYVRLNGKSFLAHRVIWEMLHSPIIEGVEIDHIDGDGLNNREWNLREASRSQNMQNYPKPVTNTSGVKGVSRFGDRWRSSIRANGKNIYLGLHDTKGQAAVAYAKAALRYHGQFARLA